MNADFQILAIMFAESARTCRHANIHKLPREAYGVRELAPLSSQARCASDKAAARRTHSIRFATYNAPKPTGHRAMS